MIMLKWITVNALREMIRNECIAKKFKIARIKDKKWENQLKWFGHVATYGQ